jgi:hypothetical protein
MEKKIDAAAEHGIDAFIFDWYYYEDGPFLDRTVNEGFLKARNNGRVKFAFMWANHDWLKNLLPCTKGDPQVVLYPGKVSPAGFERIANHLLKREKGDAARFLFFVAWVTFVFLRPRKELRPLSAPAHS